MKLKSTLLIVAAAMALCAPQQTEAKKQAKVPTNVFERQLLFRPGDAGSKYYRITAIATALDGSTVVVADKRWDTLADLPHHIDVVSRRSTDLGKTWSEAVTVAGEDTNEGYGDPIIIVDKKRKQLVCVMTHGAGLWEATYNKHAYISVSRSKDNGLTWSEPVDITNQLYGSTCSDSVRSKWVTAFTSSGAGLQLKNGRLEFALVVKENEEPAYGKLTVYSCYSDDGGYNWELSENAADPDGDESKIVELKDGKLLMSIRNRQAGLRKYCISEDKGKTWGEPYTNADVLDPACNGDIIRFNYNGKDVLLQTVPYHESERTNVSILASFDEGKTWPVRRAVCPYESAYSSIAQLSDGTIGIFTEEWSHDDQGYQLWYTRISPDWLFEQSK